MLVIVGLSLAAASAATSQVGFLLRQRGAVHAPDVQARHPVRSAIGLFTSKWWTIGYAVAVVAYGLHVAAMRLAPLSLVQAVLAGGLVMLAAIAERFFGFKVGRRGWVGVGLASVGLAALALTGESGSGENSAEYSLAGMLAFEGALVAAGIALILVPRLEGVGDRGRGLALGAAAGLMFSVTHVAVKAMTGVASDGPLALLTSLFLPLVVVCFVVAFFASARSLQVGDAVPVIAITTIAGTAPTIPAGIVVFGDPLGSDALEIAVRCLAFVTVVAATALIPAPTRAGEKARGAGMREAGREPAVAGAGREPRFRRWSDASSGEPLRSGAQAARRSSVPRS
jgi:drug/metabolite transporter (DMT)-like permease